MHFRSNSQKIFNAGILEHLKPQLSHADSGLLRAALAVMRALCLDDDIRVEYGMSHDHARTIASDTLCAITELLESKFLPSGHFTYLVFNNIMHRRRRYSKALIHLRNIR